MTRSSGVTDPLATAGIATSGEGAATASALGASLSAAAIANGFGATLGAAASASRHARPKNALRFDPGPSLTCAHATGAATASATHPSFATSTSPLRHGAAQLVTG